VSGGLDFRCIEISDARAVTGLKFCRTPLNCEIMSTYS
jgi:hypothetical protein